MNKKVKITSVSTKNISTSEILIEEDILDNFDEINDTLEFIGDFKYSYPFQVCHIIKVLTQLKNEGSNYLSLEYDELHEVLKLQGLDIQPLTDSEIEKEKIHTEIKLLKDIIDSKTKSIESMQNEIERLLKIMKE